MAITKPSLLVLFQPGANLVGVQKIAALRRGISSLNLGCDLYSVVGKPPLLLVEHVYRILDEFIEGIDKFRFARATTRLGVQEEAAKYLKQPYERPAQQFKRAIAPSPYFDRRSTEDAIWLKA